MSPALSMACSNESRQPVMYRREDYIGLFRHLVILAIDGTIICLGIGMLFGVLPFIDEPNQGLASILAYASSMFMAWWYLAILKPSRFRSPGYWLTGARIVTLYGERPTCWQMTLRMFLGISWFVGFPLDLFSECLWTISNDDRQMLRDTISGTRLVRNAAIPYANGRITYCLLTIFGKTYLYPRVQCGRSCPGD